MKVRGLIGRSAVVVAATALASSGMILVVGASAGAESVEKSFEDDGDHEYVVPEGVCWVSVEAFGAQGGDGIGPADDVDGPIIPGGLGGGAEARIPVTPGETLWVFVGGAGEDTEPVAGTDENVLPGEGGFNGGGDGGAAGGTEGDGGAGGGGASDVRQGGTDLDHRVLVAGGGGGAAVVGELVDFGSQGGDGGGEEGDDGESSRPEDGIVAIPEQGGEGGNEDEGGDGGISNLASLDGDDGEFGEGGDGGGNAADNDTDGGGGGGGGWYGGGGGGGSDEDAPVPPPHVHDGAGGGGGSGYGPDGVEFDTGEQEGDGEVTISYDPVTDACAAEAIVIEPKFTG